MPRRFCGSDDTARFHTIRLKTGRETSRQLAGVERLDPTRVRSTFVVQHGDIERHCYTLCHCCWTIARREVLFLLFTPVVLFVAYLAGTLFDDDQDGVRFLAVLVAMVLLLAMTVVLVKFREPWHRLQRLAVKERGGGRFEVIEGKEDGSNRFLP